MSDPNDKSYERARLLAKSVARWDNEGGAGEGGRMNAMPGHSLTDSLPLTNVELENCRSR